MNAAISILSFALTAAAGLLVIKRFHVKTMCDADVFSNIFQPNMANWDDLSMAGRLGSVQTAVSCFHPESTITPTEVKNVVLVELPDSSTVEIDMAYYKVNVKSHRNNCSNRSPSCT